MTGPEVSNALLVSQSPRRQLPTLGFLAALLSGYVLLGAVGVIPRLLMWFGIVVFGVVLLVGLYGVGRARTSSWELRLDPEGVTVRGHSTRPWSDVAEVRITGLQPSWFFFLSFGYRVVAFIGRPGVDLPALPSTKLLGSGGGSDRLRDRWYGTQLLLLPYAYDASTESIAGAVKRFSDVPVRGSC